MYSTPDTKSICEYCTWYCGVSVYVRRA
ncbi:MAG: hypothetical protein ACK5XN_14750 [Bacteroidota bacterium]